MNQNPTFEFVVDKDNKQIAIKREFDAELPMVWDAFTKSEILDEWWAPKPWRSRTKSMNFTPGGKWLYAMLGPNGEEHWAIAEFLSIDKHKSFEVRDAFADAYGVVDTKLPQAKWLVTFTSRGEKTQVDFKIAYDKLADLEKTLEMGFKDGLRVGMEQLDELLPTLEAHS